MTTLCFVDTETTGLDPDLHEIWEVAIILRRPADVDPIDAEFVWQLPVDLGRADPIALNIGRFHERRAETNVDTYAVPTHGTEHRAKTVRHWCQEFARLTWGAHMIGCVPSFDTERLARLLRANGACPGWHYQPIDVETLAAGYLLGLESEVDDNAIDHAARGRAHWAHAAAKVARELPWSSEDLATTLGTPADQELRHTALGDARWARDLWDRIQ